MKTFLCLESQNQSLYLGSAGTKACLVVDEVIFDDIGSGFCCKVSQTIVQSGKNLVESLQDWTNL